MSDELQRSMGRVEAKVDLLLIQTAGFEGRLGKVEKKVWWASGASSVLAFIAARVLGGH